MYLSFLQGINFNACAYRFKKHPNTDTLHEAVSAGNFFGDGAESGIFMPTGRKRKVETMSLVEDILKTIDEMKERYQNDKSTTLGE